MQIQSKKNNRNYFLLTKEEKIPFPLQDIDIQVDVCNQLGHFRFRQTFFNPSDRMLETVFIFPLETDMVVSSLSAKFGDEEIVTSLEEEQIVRQKVEEARKKGETFVQGSYHEKDSDDIFSLQLGNIPPKTQAVVEIIVYQKLDIDDLSYRLRIPTIYTPRYALSNENFEQLLHAKLENKDERPKRIQVNNDKSYNWNIQVNIQSLGELLRAESLNHAVLYQKIEQNVGIVQIKDEDKHLIHEKDFVLLIRDSYLGQLECLSSVRDNNQGIMLTYTPDFRPSKLKEQMKELFKKKGILLGKGHSEQKLLPTDEEIQQQLSEKLITQYDIQNCEYYFLLDRSGSMAGKSIELAVEALKLFIQSLPTGCKFNVVSFGTKFEFLFKKSAEYNDKSLKESFQKIELFKADMGGTEILDPLKMIFESVKDSKMNTQIFLLTDGDVSNTQQVINLIKYNSSSRLKLHTFGIGSGVSTDLVKKCALNGGGMFYFIDDAKEIEKKVIDALCQTILPYLKIKKLELFDSEDKQIEIPQNHFDEVIVNGRSFQQVLFLESEPEAKKIVLEIYDPNSSQTDIITVNVEKPSNTFDKCVFNTCLKNYLNTVPQNQKIELSKKYQVLCQGLSFFASKKIVNNDGQVIHQPIVTVLNLENNRVYKGKKAEKPNLAVGSIDQQLRAKISQRRSVLTTTTSTCKSSSSNYQDESEDDEDEMEESLEQICEMSQKSCQFVADVKSKKKSKASTKTSYPSSSIQSGQQQIINGPGYPQLQMYQQVFQPQSVPQMSFQPQIQPQMSFQPQIQPQMGFQTQLISQSQTQFNDQLISQSAQYSPNKSMVKKIIQLDIIQEYNKKMIDKLMAPFTEEEKVSEFLKEHVKYQSFTLISNDKKIPKSEWEKSFGELNLSGRLSIEVIDYKSVAFLQSADGSWNNAVLELNILFSEAQTLGINQELKQVDQKFHPTIFGLLVLNKFFLENKNQWRMIEKKAQTFLQNGLPETNLSDLLNKLTSI